MVYTLPCSFTFRRSHYSNAGDKTNKCRIRHGLDIAVADIDNWRVTVKQFLIPKSVDSNSDSTIYGYYHPPANAAENPEGWYLHTLTWAFTFFSSVKEIRRKKKHKLLRQRRAPCHISAQTTPTAQSAVCSGNATSQPVLCRSFLTTFRFAKKLN